MVSAYASVGNQISELIMRPETTLDRPSVDPQTGKSVPARQRSRITNGALLPGVDGRNGWVRRCRDILNSHLSDMGGEDNTSAAERSIIRRASTLTVELERLEAKFAVAGQASDADLDLYQEPPAICAGCWKVSASTAGRETFISPGQPTSSRWQAGGRRHFAMTLPRQTTLRSLRDRVRPRAV